MMMRAQSNRSQPAWSAVTVVLSAAVGTAAALASADNLLRLPGGWVWDGGIAVETAGGWVGSGWRSFPGVNPPWNPVTAPVDPLPRLLRGEGPAVTVVRVEREQSSEPLRGSGGDRPSCGTGRFGADRSTIPAIYVGSGRAREVDLPAAIGILPPDEMLRRYREHREAQLRMAAPVELPAEPRPDDGQGRTATISSTVGVTRKAPSGSPRSAESSSARSDSSHASSQSPSATSRGA
jgi:hypothetical protein